MAARRLRTRTIEECSEEFLPSPLMMYDHALARRDLLPHEPGSATSGAWGLRSRLGAS